MDAVGSHILGCWCIKNITGNGISGVAIEIFLSMWSVSRELRLRRSYCNRV
jgi:hypothetical protein